MRILIADDDSSNLEILRILLESRQHIIITAGNGTVALQKARESRPDLIISDILMPDMDGFALCRAWMKDPALKPIPFIFYTATYLTEEDEALGRSLGAADFLHKPMEPDALLVQIEAVLRRAEVGGPDQEPVADLDEGTFLKLYNERLVQKLDHRHAAMVRQLATLQETEAQLRLKGAALEAASNGVMITDRDGRIIWTNSAFQAMTGYGLEDLLGLSIRICDPEHPVPAFFGAIWQPVVAGLGWVGELIGRRKDGSVRTFHSTVTPLLDGNGNTTEVIAICQDISEQKRAEAELRQAQKMDAVGRLAGGVAHDFNNMLGVIFLDTELLLLQEGMTEVQRTLVKGIKEAAERSAELTRQLLTFSRKQTGMPVVTALNPVLADSYKMLGRLVGENLEITFRPGADLCPVLIDPGEVRQILVNLVINARDAMTEAGVIQIQTANVHLDADSPQLQGGLASGEYVLLTVSDTGQGMAPEILEHIFEPFFTTKEVGKGTGLGLSVVYGIVKQNGGAILAYSQQGIGTTIKIYLPACQASEAAAVGPPAPVDLPRGTETILIAEDEPTILSIVQRALEGLGYRVLSARDPAEALQLAMASGGRIDLLVTDVVMPGMNGPELLAKVAGLNPGIRVLFMSGYTGEIIATRGLLKLGPHFLQKPFRIMDLALKVRAALT